MSLFASNQSLWDSYEVLGRKAIETIHAYDGTQPVHGTFRLDPSQKGMDDYSKAFVRFMDARVEGIGADEMMSASAADFYSKNGDLYFTGAYLAYGPAGIRGSSEEFFARIDYPKGRSETIWLQSESGGRPPVITEVGPPLTG